jgi:hypothetical protein
MQKALSERDQLKKQADDMKGLADGRFYWIGILTDLRAALMQAEAVEKSNLRTPDNGGTNTDEGVWVEEFTPVMPESWSAGAQTYASGTVGGGGGGGGGSRRYGGRRGGAPAPMGMQDTGHSAAAPPGVNEVVGLKLTCRAINRPGGKANDDLAYTVQQCLTNSPSFTNAILGDPYYDQDTNTFKFDVSVDLRHRFKLALAP